MKRIILFFLTSILISINVLADKEISILVGNTSIFKENEIALVEFEWDGATWNNDISLEEQWGKDYAQIVSESEATFIAQFNKKNKKKLQLSDQIENSSITIFIKITNADKHWLWGIVTSIWGTITVVQNGTEVLKVQLSKIEGDSDNSADDSVARCFQEIANKLLKLK